MHRENFLQYGLLIGLYKDLSCDCDCFIGILEDFIDVSLPMLQLHLDLSLETLCKLYTLLTMCFEAKLGRLILKGHAAFYITFGESKEGVKAVNLDELLRALSHD